MRRVVNPLGEETAQQHHAREKEKVADAELLKATAVSDEYPDQAAEHGENRALGTRAEYLLPHSYLDRKGSGRGADSRE